MELAHSKLTDDQLAAPQRLYYLSGPEEADKKALVARLKVALDVDEEGFDYTPLDGREIDLAQLIAFANTPPVLADRRFILLRHAQRLSGKSATELGNLPDFVCLVVWPESDGETASAKTLLAGIAQIAKKIGLLIKFEPLAGPTLEKRLIEVAKQSGKELQPAVAKRLMELLDGRADLCQAELQKLILYVGERPRIASDDLSACVTPTKEARVFALVDAISVGDPARALARLSEIWAASSKPEEALKTLGLIARQYRLLYQARMLREQGARLSRLDGGTDELPKETNLADLIKRQPFLAGKLENQAGRLSPDKLLASFRLISTADKALKGLAPGVNEREILERLTLELAVNSN